jgi:hypothetical protein
MPWTIERDLFAVAAEAKVEVEAQVEVQVEA